MMSDCHKRWKGRVLAGALILGFVVAGGWWQEAVGQQDNPTATGESSSPEPAVREGDWVDITFGTGIEPETRALVGEGTTFAADGHRVYCLTRVHGLTPPTTVTHAWYHDGKTMARVDLPVGSENWRTWSFKTYLPAWTGSWEVKVLNEDGMVLGAAGFEVK